MNHEQQKIASVRGAGHVFSDGQLVELCYDRDKARTYFVVGDFRKHEVVDQIQLNAATELIPIAPENNLIRHRVVMLPEKLDESGTPDVLAADIEAFMDRFLALSPDFRLVASTFVLLSWVYDRFNELPYLRFRGDFGTGKSRALQVIGSLVYKGVFASGASTVSPIFHILDSYRGSLVLDEADFRFSDEKAELSKILNNGNVRGFPVLRQTVNAKKEFDPKAFQVFGPKLIACRRSFDDLALESRFLTEEMGFMALPDHIPHRMPEHWTQDALSLRNRLLGYRFKYRHTIAVDQDFRDAARSARTNQIIGPLLAVAPTERHCAAIVAYAAQLETDVQSGRRASFDAALIEVLVGMMEPGLPIPVADIAVSFGRNVADETDRNINPKYTGILLRKRLHLQTVRAGGLFFVPVTEFPKIMALARRYSVEATGSEAAPGH